MAQNEIMTFKLASGEEVVARCVEQLEHEMVIKDPMAIVAQPGPNGVQLGFVPAMLTATDTDTVSLNRACIVMAAKANNDAENAYLKNVTGIDLDTSKIQL
jgi:hypothetical protein